MLKPKRDLLLPLPDDAAGTPVARQPAGNRSVLMRLYEEMRQRFFVVARWPGSQDADEERRYYRTREYSTSLNFGSRGHYGDDYFTG